MKPFIGKSPRGTAVRRAVATVLVSAAVLAGAVTLTATPASAIGDNRVVTRSCGTNWIGSYYLKGGYDKAETIKETGSCQGRLWAGLRGNSEYLSSGNSLYASYTGLVAMYGVHKGCDSCGKSLT